MSAPRRTIRNGIRQKLGANRDILVELARLEDASNKHIRRSLPGFTYTRNEINDRFLEDLTHIVSDNDWRREFEGVAENLKRASDRICDAVESLLTVAEKCPRYATIPIIVRQALPGADAERETVGPMSSEEFTERLKAYMIRESRKVVGRERLAPGFLRQMLTYASHCKNEAGRIQGILKARDKRYDRLGPMLDLIRDMDGFTGTPNDQIVAVLLFHAYEVSGRMNPPSTEAIRKIRERYLTL